MASAGARAQAGVRGGQPVNSRRAPASSATTWFSPARVSSSSPSPCTIQAASVPEPGQRFGHRARPVGGEHAGELAPHAGRIRHRSEQVEDRARAKLDPRAGGVAHRGMVARREQEGAAGGAQDVGQPVQRHVDVDAERGQHVGPAGARGQRPVAVLGDRHAAAGDDEGDGGGDVQRAGIVAAGAADVDRVGWRGDPRSCARASRGPRR